MDSVCYTVLCVLSSFANILIGKRELVALLQLFSCLVTVRVLWLTEPRAGLQCDCGIS